MDIVVAKSLDEVNCVALKDLIEGCFGKKIVDGYFSNKEFIALHLAMQNQEDVGKGPYAGAIIATNPVDIYPVEIAYIDKIVVAEQYRGNGVFPQLWGSMTKTHPKFFLRAKKTNPASEIYKEKAELCHEDETWNIYQSGLDPKQARWAVSYAMNLPESLIPKKSRTAERPQVPLEQRAPMPLF